MLVPNQKAPNSSTSTGLPEGWVSVADYGAVGDGVTSDDAAFAAAVATKKHVYVPNGTITAQKHYLLSQTITVNKGQLIKGDWTMTADFSVIPTSMTSSSAIYTALLGSTPTCLLFTGTTNFLFDLANPFASVEGLYVFQHASYVPTAGGAFRFGGNDTLAFDRGNFINDTCIKNCTARNVYQGVYGYGQVYKNRLEGVTVNSAVAYGYCIEIAVPFGDLRWHNFGSSSAGIANMYVKACDTSQFTMMWLPGSPRNLWIAGDSTKQWTNGATTYSLGCHQLSFTSIRAENATTTTGNAILIGDGVGGVSRCTITNAELYSEQYGAFINVGTYAHEVEFVAPVIMGLKFIDYGRGTRITGGTNRYNATIQAGVGLDLRGTETVINGFTNSGRATGTNIAAGANNITIIGSPHINNTTHLTADAAAKATGRGSANLNLTDW